MPRSDNVMELPKDLPIPQDDGACDHLTGMKLPTFDVDGMKLIKRITLIVRDGTIGKVFYPVSVLIYRPPKQSGRGVTSSCMRPSSGSAPALV